MSHKHKIPKPDPEDATKSSPHPPYSGQPPAESPSPAEDSPAVLAVPPALQLSAADLKIDLACARPSSGTDADALQEELADDMLELTKQMAAQDARLTALTAAVAQLEATLEGMARAQGIEMERLKEVLISDRKELIGRSTFNALVPAMESLRYLDSMHHGHKLHASLRQQTRTILDLLTGIAQSLGYRAMEVEKGAPFDPQTMECVGFEEGEPGRVLRVDGPGYRAGSVLVRPCRVILGRPKPQAGPAVERKGETDGK
jgi:molecular chaperone GrpE (heat shock protein)